MRSETVHMCRWKERLDSQLKCRYQIYHFHRTVSACILTWRCLRWLQRPAQINLADRLHEVLTESLGAVETYWSKYNVLWWRLCSSKLKKRQRLAYLNAAAYPMVAIPVAVYCILPAICLITNKFIVGKVRQQRGPHHWLHFLL